MIEMIAGVFGMPIKDKNGKTIRIKGMGPGDGPFSASPEREAELVKKGVARYAEPAKTDADQQDDFVDTGTPIGFDETPPVDTEDDVTPKPLEELSRDELRDVCKEYGLPYKATDSKAKLIEIIAEFQNSAADTEDTPVFDAAEAVE